MGLTVQQSSQEICIQHVNADGLFIYPMIGRQMHHNQT